MAAILADALVRTYGSVEALRGVSFTIPVGQRVALLGRSGSGKSTLLHLLAGLDRPTSGSLSVFGQSLSSLDAAGLANYRLRTVGIIFQAFHLLSARSVRENVSLPLILSGVAREERLRRTDETLAAVGMTHRADAFPPTLSGGESQRVAIARALIARPRLLLADEPTGNLDSDNAERVRTLLLEQVVAHGITLVLVTHDQTLAHQMAERVLRLHDGQLVEDR
jgi:predicted ABC-type transport system involved in lysophospholipase L1 biosynthesis ATPase subunit